RDSSSARRGVVSPPHCRTGISGSRRPRPAPPPTFSRANDAARACFFAVRRLPRLNVHTDLSFVTLILHASIIVQAVIVLLAVLSLWSWWQIFLKLFQLKRATRETNAFEDEFWNGGDLAELFQRASQARVGGGLEHIFTAGFREYSKHRRQGSTSGITLDSARRAMRAAYQREIDTIEANLAGLATVGSVSPY